MRIPFRKMTAAEAIPAGAAVATVAAPASASVDTGNVRQFINFDWAMNQEEYPEIDTYWWWVVSVRVDPNEVWCEDEDGTLWVVPFATDGEDTITITGAPTQSRLVAVPVSAADGATASAAVSRRRQRVAAAFHERPTKPDRPTQAAASAVEPDNERNPMDPAVLQALARQHGLDPDTATEADINAAVIAAAATPPTDDPETPEETPEVDAPAADAPAADPVAEQRDAELVAATERIAELERDRDERATAAANERRDALATAWVVEGRIAPASRDHYRGLLDVDEAGTVALAAALAPNRIPVRERGATPAQASADGGSLARALSVVPTRKVA